MPGLPLPAKLLLLLLAAEALAGTPDLGLLLQVARIYGLRRVHLACRTDLTRRSREAIRSGPHPIRVTRSLKLTEEERGNVLLCAGDHPEGALAQMLNKSANAARDGNPWMVVVGDGGAPADQASVPINKEVYFLNVKNQSVGEAYNINGHEVSRFLGRYSVENFSGKVEHEVLEKRSFLDRRSNFHGQKIIAGTAEQGNNVLFPASVRQERKGWEPLVKKRPFGRYKDVTGLDGITGVFPDALRILESDLNFTTRLLVRKDKMYGYFVKGKWYGMLVDAQEGHLDMIFQLMRFPVRMGVVDISHPVSRFSLSLLVARNGLEELAWQSFLYPLRTETWVWLLIDSLALLAGLKLLQSYYQENFWTQPWLQILLDTVGDLWMIGASYFGRKPNRGATYNSARPMRILLFAVFLAGTLVFIAYRSSLTAELATRRNTLPFDSVQELYESNFKLITSGGNTFYLVGQYPDTPDSIWLKRMFYEQGSGGVKDYVFKSRAIEALIEGYRLAEIGFYEDILPYPEYACQVIEAWRSGTHEEAGFGFPKGSPYFSFFNFKLLKRIESGLLDQLLGVYYPTDLVCNRERDVTLGFLKLISVFGVLSAGAGASLAVLAVEWSWGTLKKFTNKTDEFLGNVTMPKIDQDYQDQLRRIMFKWGVSDREAYATDLEELFAMRQRRVTYKKDFTSRSVEP